MRNAFTVSGSYKQLHGIDWQNVYYCFLTSHSLGMRLNQNTCMGMLLLNYAFGFQKCFFSTSTSMFYNTTIICRCNDYGSILHWFLFDPMTSILYGLYLISHSTLISLPVLISHLRINAGPNGQPFLIFLLHMCARYLAAAGIYSIHTSHLLLVYRCPRTC
jgi:hypothetical protein